MFVKFPTHELALFLIKARNEYAYGFSIGRLSIMWDTGKPVPGEDD